MLMHHANRLLSVITLILLGLTALSAWLAESGVQPSVRIGVWALAFAWIKGGLVAEHFMELRSAPWLLRALVHGWLALVCGGLLLVFI